LDKQELLTAPTSYKYWNVDGQEKQMELAVDSVAYSICQVPVILKASDEECIQVYFSDGSVKKIDGYMIDLANSRHILQRDGAVDYLLVRVRFDG
jgi:hypothetical protein